MPVRDAADLDAAEPLCREVRDGTIAQKGEDHPDSLTAINNHIALLYSRGRLADMQPLLERLVHVRQRVLGDDHPDTIGTINNLAAVSYRLHDFATAARWFGECLDRMDRASEVPPTSQTYLAVLANLAAAERELGHYDRSIELGERALGLKIEVYGRSHDSTLQTMTMLADAYRQQGDFDHGLEMFTACRALAAAGESPQLANVYRCDLGLARCHAGRREFEQAEQLLLRCRDTYDASDAAATSRGMLTRPESDLIGLYEASGRSEEAARLRAAAEPTAAAGKR